MRNFIIRIVSEHFAFGLLIPVYIILLTEQLDLTLIQAGFAVSVTTVAVFIFEIPSGIIADKIDRKYLLFFSSSFHLASYITLFFSKDLSLVLISAILTGIGFALASGAEESYVHDVAESTAGSSFEKRFSWVSISDEVATISGMLLGSLILTYFDYSALIGLAILSLIVAVTASLFIEGSNQVNKAEGMLKESHERMNYKKSIFTFIGVFLLLSILYESGRLLWQPHLISNGWSVTQLGYIFASIKLGSIMGAYAAGSVKIRNIYAVLLGGFVGAIGLFIFSTETVLVSLCGLAIFLLAENFVRIHTTSFILSLPNVSNRKATILSIFSIVNNSYLSASGVILGTVATSISLSDSLMYVAGVKIAAVFCLTLYIFISKHPHFSADFQTHSK